MISKELLSKVLELKDCEFKDYNYSEIEYYYKIDIDFSYIEEIGSINIYELAHKCKEWAWDNTRSFYRKYYGDIDSISSGIHRQNKFYCEVGYGSGEHETFEADIEPEAIFKACQWILDNKDK